ncbi:MAG: hypothetical protein CMJ88_05680 [Planctomycetes bacterium]|nr:hypothetical protein [Planctomycetota bacterium]
MLTMRWEDLLFLHWPVDPAVVRQHVPEELEIDTFDGAAWLGVVPFTMASTRFRWLPPMPTANRFPECNLRTYVRCGGRPGGWFFSLDAHSRLAVEGARLGFGLPYFRADMRSHQDDGAVIYRSRRTDRRGPPAVFEGAWRPGGAWSTAAAGSLEHFLVERYSLFAMRRGRMLRGDVRHQPWQLARADVRIDQCDMAQLIDFKLQGEPASALAARPIEVEAARPVLA